MLPWNFPVVKKKGEYSKEIGHELNSYLLSCLALLEEPLITTVMNKWNSALDLVDSETVQCSRGLHIWKCYYFVTKASRFSNHFNIHATESSIFNHFVRAGVPFSNGEHHTVKWSFSEKGFTICCDYTWISNSCSSYLITASGFWRGAPPPPPWDFTQQNVLQ